MSSKMWASLMMVFSYADSSDEKQVLTTEVECGQLATTAATEMIRFGETSGRELDLGKLLALTKSYKKFVDCSKRLASMQRPQHIEGSFANFMDIPSPEICGYINMTARQLRQKIAPSVSMLEELLQPCEGWKQGFTADTPVEEVVSAADETLMQMKGKKTTSQALLLKQARQSNQSYPHFFCLPGCLHFWNI